MSLLWKLTDQSSISVSQCGSYYFQHLLHQAPHRPVDHHTVQPHLQVHHRIALVHHPVNHQQVKNLPLNLILYMKLIVADVWDRRANKAFHLDLALLTSLECTLNSGFSCLNTEKIQNINFLHNLLT